MAKSAELAYWINERYAMKLRKDRCESSIRTDDPRNKLWEHGWSDDPHMGLVRYCNVHREDDKVTEWLAENWRPNHHAVWEIVLARMINYIPSLEEVLAHWGASRSDPPALAGVRLKARRERGEKVFTSAYTISTCGQSMDKIDYVVGVAEAARKLNIDGFWDQISDPVTLGQAAEDIQRIRGISTFLAAQVIADLKNTKGHPLQDAPDWHTWAAPGPGSLRGLTEYFEKPVTPRTFEEAIAVCWREVEPLLPTELQDLHMQDFQNCLCEFSKFMRVRRGGHVRNRYSAG